MTQPGVMPNLMQVLQVKENVVLCAVLNVINLFIKKDKRVQENMARIGLIPIIFSIILKSKVTRENRPVRKSAATFIGFICKNSSLTLQMFVSCGGLPVLVDLLSIEKDSDENENEEPSKKEENSELFQIALDGITSVFTLPRIPKNDLCRLFIKAEILSKLIPLFNARIHTYVEETSCQSPSQLQVVKNQLSIMGDLFQLFSRGDFIVKENMSELQVVQRLLSVCAPQKKDLFLDEFYTFHVISKSLKSIRNLSMDLHTVDRLDRAGTIPALFQTVQHSREALSAEAQRMLAQTMFYLCRINRERQTQVCE